MNDSAPLNRGRDEAVKSATTIAVVGLGALPLGPDGAPALVAANVEDLISSQQLDAPAARIFLVVHDESVTLPILNDRSLAALPVTRATFLRRILRNLSGERGGPVHSCLPSTKRASARPHAATVACSEVSTSWPSTTRE